MSRARLRQRGAALLAAMITVTLVATLAAAGLWQQWRSVEVEAAERARGQAAWVLTGALDWARLILREDARAGGADHLAEPWAVPLEEARLSTFLAADRNAAVQGSDAEDAFLSGQITDRQALLNVNVLLDGGRIHPGGLAAFQRLFAALGLPDGQAQALAEGLQRASGTAAGDPSAALAPLLPQTVAQLAWLGLPPATLAALQPHVTVLPGRTPVNLNTASAQVVQAVLPGTSLADAQRLVAARQSSHFRTLADAAAALGGTDQALGDGLASVATRFFEVRGRLRLGDSVVEEHSLVQRDGLDVRVLRRERSALLAPSAAAR